MTKSSYSSIQLTEKTKDRLKKLGRMGDSYEKIINELVDYYENGKKE